MMYGLLSSFSWTIRARIPIWAARPLFNSIARFESFLASSHLRIFILSSQPASTWGWAILVKAISQIPMKMNVWISDSKGTALGPAILAKPAAQSANLTPGATSPGNLYPDAVIIWP